MLILVVATIENNAYIIAQSIITEDIDQYGSTIGRSKQTIKKQYMKK